MNGFCKLCRRDNVDIQKSHYVPAALYPKNVSLEYVDRNGIVRPVTPGSDIKTYLLCVACEQRFSIRGESEVLRHVAGKIVDKANPLARKLEPLAPVVDDGSLKSYCGTDAALNMDMFAYFALSIAWRSTHSWPVPGSDETRPLKLGLFTEPIRRFLAGETPQFPDHTAVTVFVCTDKMSRETWTLPAQADEVWTHDIKFLTFGVQFRVTVGRSMHPWVRRDSCHASGKMIHLVDCETRTSQALGAV
jgi:hypothetical protein